MLKLRENRRVSNVTAVLFTRAVWARVYRIGEPPGLGQLAMCRDAGMQAFFRLIS
jgi:hypothetical protein